jgi:peptidoglycan/LPS O-acetylase OafA/YrhL
VLVLVVLGKFVGGFEVHSAGTYVSNFFMVSDLFKTDSISGVYWTLLIDVKFYIFIAFYFFFLKSRFISLALFLMIVANGVVFMIRGQASPLLTFFPVFFVGIQVFLAEKSGWVKRELARLFLITVVVGLSVLFYDQIYGAWSLVYVFGGAVAMVCLLRSGLSNKSLAFFGKISYSNYLYHTVVGYFLFGLIGFQETWIGNLLVVLAVTALTALVAYVSYRAVELPFVRFWKTHESKWIHGSLR